MRMSSQPFGESYQPLSPEQLADPYSFYALARQQQPIFYSALLDAYVVTRFKDIHALLTNPAVSSSNTLRPLVHFYPQTFLELSKGYPFVPIVINSDGEAHKRLRAPFNKAMSPRRVASMEPFIRARANSLVDRLINDGHAEMMSQFASPLSLEVIFRLFGLEPQDMAEAKAGSEAWLTLVSSQLDEPSQAQSARGTVAFQKLVARYVTQRSTAPGEDLISDMLAALAPDERPLTYEQEAELVQNVGGVLLAGHMTSSDLIGNGLKLLLEHPEQWQLLGHRPDLIPSAIEEIARFDPAVQAFFRVATQEVTMEDKDGGATLQLPAGTQFLLLYASANRDETVFSNADQFDITRSPNRHLAFGFGEHFCAGAPLARKEMEIVFQTLTQRLPNLRLASNQTFEHEKTLMFRGYQRLFVEWD